MTDLLMPKLGLTMTEGLLSEWHVALGATFQAGDLLFTVETEKVANEVEAESDGVLSQILVEAGMTVPVGTPLARLSGAGTIETQSESFSPASPSAASPQSSPMDGPAARKLMADHQINREDIQATGRDGRVMKEDVLRVVATPLARRIAQNQGVDLTLVEGSGPRGRIKARDVEAARTTEGTSPVMSVTAKGVTEIIPDAVRRATAHKVSAAKRDIPHFYVSHEAELTSLMQLRSDLNADDERPRISVTHMLIRALGLALTEMPELNRIWVDDRILAFKHVDVGMVAETPDGLRIPVIRDAGSSSLDQIAAQAHEVMARAREGGLKPTDVGEGAISVSNVGMFGVSSLTPIINPPNAMILGVGAEREVFRPGADRTPELRREMTLTLACDHRVIDGADAARFLSAVVSILETPIRLLRPAHRPA